ncbi:MAG: type II toxin-antitoxin system HicB family antitoxin [Patescibacteria group bacterium]|nr:type II toxin-antitoxin system HicB family antitoxin [Patescibacteria group bacterium]
MNTRSFRTIIEKDEDGYHGYVPALPGCHTWGKTIEETQINLREAIQGMLISMKNHGDLIPVDTTIETIETIDITTLSSPAMYA